MYIFIYIFWNLILREDKKTLKLDSLKACYFKFILYA